MTDTEAEAAAAADARDAGDIKVIVLNYGKWKDAAALQEVLRARGVPFLKVKKSRMLSFGFVHFGSEAERERARPLLAAVEWGGEKLEFKDARPKRSLKPMRSGKRKSREGDGDADGEGEGEGEDDGEGGDEPEVTDARQVVTPWADVPYREQLERKEAEMKKVLTKIVRNTRKEYGKKEKRVAQDQRNIAKKKRKQEQEKEKEQAVGAGAGANATESAADTTPVPPKDDGKPKYIVQIPEWLTSHGSLYIVANKTLFSCAHESVSSSTWTREVEAENVVAIVSFGSELVAVKTDGHTYALKKTPTGRVWEKRVDGPGEAILSLASLRGSLLCCTESGKILAQDGIGTFASGVWRQIGQIDGAKIIAVHNGFVYVNSPSAATQWWRAPLSSDALDQLAFEAHDYPFSGVLGIASHNTQMILLMKDSLVYALSDGTIEASYPLGLETQPSELTAFASHKGLCCPMDSIHPSPSLEGYRNKCEFSIGFDADGKPCVGFRLGLFRNGSVVVSKPDQCINVSATMKEVCATVQTMIENSEFPVYDVKVKDGVWRQLTVRRAERTGDLMVIVMVNLTKLSSDEKEKLKALVVSTLTNPHLSYQVKSLYLHEYGGVSAPTEDDPVEKICGADTIEEQMLGLRFSVSPNAFFQVNTSAAENLYSLVKAHAAADENTLLYDVCCGTGTIGICSSQGVAKVVGIEICKAATDDAAVNAKLNNIENVSFINSKAEDVMKDLLKTKRSESDQHLNKVVAIVDPPRAGLHHQVLRALRGCPPVQRIVYVSCNPTNSLIQDAVTLCGPKTKSVTGEPFRPVHAIPVDLFPHTPHCEMVIVFERV